jgi:streptogramin lyase
MIYIADNRTIRKVTDAGVVTTLAGDPTQSGSADGAGSAARFAGCRGICIAPNGDLFVTDRGATGSVGTVRKVTQAGVVTTIAGSPTQGGSADGTGSSARFLNPYGIAIAPGGDLFVCDLNNSTIRRVTQAGVVTTFAGSVGAPGSQNGTGSSALFSGPVGIAIDSSGNVFVAETNLFQPNNFTIRQITPSAVVTTFAGAFGQSGTTDGTGSAARFVNPKALTIDSSGNLFLVDGTKIRKITPGAVVTTVGGTQGELVNPYGLAVNSTGKVYIVDTDNYVLREQQT